MSDPLHSLLDVQSQDTIGDQIRHRRDNHPLRAELAALDAERAELAARLAAEQETLSALEGRQAQLEGEAAAGRARVETIEKRMYSGEVAAARDLQAMSEEVAGLRERVSRLEDVTLEVMEEREPVEVLVGRLGGELAALDERRGRLAQDLQTAERQLAEEEAAHAEQRERLAAAVPADLLARYERLRSRLGGVGVAPLVDGRCGGCHLTLPATELERIRRAPADEVLVCEQCGRILVRP